MFLVVASEAGTTRAQAAPALISLPQEDNSQFISPAQINQCNSQRFDQSLPTQEIHPLRLPAASIALPLAAQSHRYQLLTPRQYRPPPIPSPDALHCGFFLVEWLFPHGPLQVPHLQRGAFCECHPYSVPSPTSWFHQPLPGILYSLLPKQNCFSKTVIPTRAWASSLHSPCSNFTLGVPSLLIAT